MNQVVGETGRAALEQPQHPVRGPTAVADPLTAELSASPNFKGLAALAVDRMANLFSQRW
ncbi:MAG: hypothetical protein IPF55_19775 [Rhodoferax sp.]|nr:hypothetical protein [Rhodoferax sp.]